MKRTILTILSALLFLPIFTSRGDGKEAEIPVRYTEAYPQQEPFYRPIFLTHTPADPGHVYVMEQAGIIWRIPDDPESGEREKFVELGAKVLGLHNGGGNEEGLLGFAFDPDYGTNGFVYVYYSHKTTGQRAKDGKTKKPGIERESVVARYSTREVGGIRRVDEASELKILTVPQPWGNHNGGTLVFGPDGFLYIAFGDGGAAADRGGNGQNLGTILATVSRIDVGGASKDKPYAIPPDNPFVGVKGARPEIYAYGLRNPWRISFDRRTGDLWCGDVGQNRWEEVDRIVSGGNYGWPVREGTHPFDLYKGSPKPGAKFVEPIADYPRTEGVCVTGGYVYRGKAIPSLIGRYLYADYSTMRVWAVREDRKGGAHHVATLPTAPMPVASFAELPDGELLLCCFMGENGRIFRILPVAAPLNILLFTADDLGYNPKTDPACVHNLVGDPDAAMTTKVLRAQLREWMAKTKDPVLPMFDARRDRDKMAGELKMFPSKESLMPEAQLAGKKRKAAGRKNKRPSDEERRKRRQARRAAQEKAKNEK